MKRPAPDYIDALRRQLGPLAKGMFGEYRFHPTRRWRFDIAWPARKIAVEIQGGIFIRGAHSRCVGQLRDFGKMNAAQAMGWRVFQFTPGQVFSRDGAVALFLREVLDDRED